MVKTRSQQKISFPRRKSKSRSKSAENFLEESKAKSCCMATLARVCRDIKSKEVKATERSRPSPAKKTRKNGDVTLAMTRHRVPEKVQTDNAVVLPGKTRRALSYTEDEENNFVQATAQATLQLKDRSGRRPSTNGKHPSTKVKHTTQTHSPKPANTKITNIVVHSPKKSLCDATSSKMTPPGSPLKIDNSPHGFSLRCNSVHGSLHPSPLKHSSRLDRSAVSPCGKRRHSSAADENDAEQWIEPRLRSKSLTVASRHQNSPSDSVLKNLTPNKQMLCLVRQEGQAYKEAKRALHSSIPSNLLCRETETKQIETFLKVHLSHCKAGSLYISGAPGTGKTACLTHILENTQKDGVECQVQFINCMNLSRSHRIYSKIAEELTGWDKLTNKEAQKFLEKKFTGKGLPMVLVLDEIDLVESKNQDVLYTMFEWPSLPSSRLILIGIANALDLTDRVLPRLQLRPECKPKLLHFSPYSKDQIVKILTARLSEVEGSNIVDVSAIQFCARKIAAVSGDMRKALDICRRAVEVVESEVKKQQILKPIDIIASPKSPKKAGMKKVTIADVSKVISEVYGSRIVSSCGGEQPTIPLQQKLLICTILLLQKESKLREIPVGQLHETYCNICKKRQMSQINQEDCLSLCNLLETRGIISMKRAKETRMTKVSLKIEEHEVDHALHDKILMSSILQGGLSPYSKDS